jgi:hypothetical protein
MANTYRPTYDPRNDSGTSGAEVSDLNPEQAYDTDMRRIATDERSSAASVNNKQERVAKFMRAAKSAGAYKQRAQISEPTVYDEDGDAFGAVGAKTYARKPQPQFGKSFQT